MAPAFRPRYGTRCSIPSSRPSPPARAPALACSISHDIIVKQHSGSIEVDTQPGEFTEVRIVLPRVAALVAGGQP